MRTNQKVNTYFRDYKDEDIAVLANVVLAAMTDNPFFENPSVSLIKLKEVKDKYLSQLIKSRGQRSPYKTAKKNEARRALEQSLSQLAVYVNVTAAKDIIKLLSSGFALSKYRNKVLPPDNVRRITLKDGAVKGQMVLSFRKVASVKFYEYRYSKEKDEAGEIIWGPIKFTSSSRNNLIKNVIPGQIYFISVRARNYRGLSDWSEPVSWMAR